jgi:hypothetical protein
MLKEIHIEYSDVTGKLKPLVLRYSINNTPIAQRWAEKVQFCIKNHIIDQPDRFYGFDDLQSEKSRAIGAINKCCDIINNYQPIIDRRVEDTITQDTLNYLHHIFEVYHGMLDAPHDFFVSAPLEVQAALAQLNIEVHRCELLVEGTGRKILPRHAVTWFGLSRNDTLELDDYQYFDDYYEYGTVYLLYAEIGKTLEDLAYDDDHYISDEAYKPFRRFTADFTVRFYDSSVESWKNNRIIMKSYYEKNKDFFDSRNLPLSHPYNRPGSIPVAKLVDKKVDYIKELKTRQFVSRIDII